MIVKSFIADQAIGGMPRAPKQRTYLHEGERKFTTLSIAMIVVTVPIAAFLQWQAMGDGQATRLVLTRADTLVMSARPASLGLRTAITRPMSCCPWAPTAEIASPTARSTSASLNA